MNNTYGKLLHKDELSIKKFKSLNFLTKSSQFKNKNRAKKRLTLRLMPATPA